MFAILAFAGYFVRPEAPGEEQVSIFGIIERWNRKLKRRFNFTMQGFSRAVAVALSLFDSNGGVIF